MCIHIASQAATLPRILKLLFLSQNSPKCPHLHSIFSPESYWHSTLKDEWKVSKLRTKKPTPWTSLNQSLNQRNKCL